MTRTDALTYAIDRLIHEASIRPADQNKDALARKLAAIESLTALRDSLAGSS